MLAAMMATATLAGSAGAAPGGFYKGLGGTDPYHAWVYYTTGTGTLTAFQTCVSGGHGHTYYGPPVSGTNQTSWVYQPCAGASISNWGYNIS